MTRWVERESISWAAVVGMVVCAAGFAIEVVADRQKSIFKGDPANSESVARPNPARCSHVYVAGRGMERPVRQ